MLDYWRPDEAFLKPRNKDQLVEIALSTGASRNLRSLSKYKKSGLVKELEVNFNRVSDAENLDEVDRKAATWLPEAMEFPAVEVKGETEAA